MSITNKLKRKANMYMKLVKTAYDIGKEAGELGFMEPITIEERKWKNKKVEIQLWDLALCAYGHIPTAVVIHSAGDINIIINSAFRKVTSREKEAVIAHELGHIACGHHELSKSELMINNLLRSIGWQSSIDKELEADEYAVTNGHHLGLQSFLARIYLMGVDSRELRQRRKALRTR